MSVNLGCSIIPWPEQMKNLQIYREEAANAAEIGGEQKKYWDNLVRKQERSDFEKSKIINMIQNVSHAEGHPY